MYDAFTAIEYAHQFYLRGVDRVDAEQMIHSFALHKYPKRRAKHARKLFIERAMFAYDKHIEISPEGFGCRKGKKY